MNILLVLIPVTTVIILIGVITFFWAVNHRQFDDLESPAVLPLMEESEHPEAYPPAEPSAEVPQAPTDVKRPPE